MTMKPMRAEFAKIFLVAAALMAWMGPAAARALSLPAEFVTVANRGAGTVSFLAARGGDLLGTRELTAGMKSEPMYAVHLSRRGVIAVGDRLNSRVVFLSDRDGSAVATAPVARGVFHMWADPQESQLWIAADQDNVFDVLDLSNLRRLKSVPVPAELARAGGRTHDIVVDERFAYGTVTGVTENGVKTDRVLKIEKATGAVLGVLKTGHDAHVALSTEGLRSPYLVVAVQEEGSVSLVLRDDFRVVRTVPHRNAHGLNFLSFDGRALPLLAVTNIGDGGRGAFSLYRIDDSAFNGQRGDIGLGVVTGADTVANTPHNVVYSVATQTAFITHSGANDTVSVIAAPFNGATGAVLKTVSTGANPFGLVLVRRSR